MMGGSSADNGSGTVRFLFINPWDKLIGPNRYLIELLRQDRNLAAQSVVALAEEGDAAEEYRAAGCRVEIWRDARLVHMRATPANLARLLLVHTLGVARAWSRMRSMRIAVVLTNSENVWFGGVAARLAGIPHLQVFHALTLEHHWGDHRALVRMYLGMLLSWNRCLVAVSRAVAAMLERNGVSSGRIAVIPNGFDIAGTVEASKRPLPANLAARLRGRHPVIVSLGRISAIKGQDLLVEALPTIVRKYPQMICLFGGELGSNEGVDNTHSFDDRLRERVAALGLENQVEFLGPVDFAPSLVRCADVYVQPSRSESFSRAVAEAAIIGAPVAAFAIGGIPEVVDSCLAEPENPAALASAILEQLQSRGQSEDAILRNRANVVDRYDAKKLVSDFREVLECATCRQPLASRWSRND